MRKADPDLPPDATRQQAAETLELGQTLFDAVIEAVSSPAAGDAAGCSQQKTYAPPQMCFSWCCGSGSPPSAESVQVKRDGFPDSGADLRL
jgi:hypothetical protein